MKKNILLFLFCFIFSFFAQAQSKLDFEELKQYDIWYTAERPDFTELDAYVRTIDYSAKTPEGIAKLCVKNCTTDYEKARAIFDWLSFNISYDTSYKIGHAQNCFKARKGVCQGYAELYKLMADSVGLNCKMIIGLGRNIKPSDGHAWNIVVLGDEHRDVLLDSCWGAGYVKNNQFSRSFVPDWFDVHPAVFVFSHYPDDAYAQLIINGPDVNTLKTTPYVNPVLFRPDGLNCLEVFDTLLKHPEYKYPISYDYLSIVVNKGFRMKKMPFTDKLLVGQTYVFEYSDPNEIISFNNKVCDVERSITEDGNIRLEVTPKKTGEFIFMYGTHYAMKFSCVTKATPFSNRKPIEHTPALANTYERRKVFKEHFIKTGENFNDGFFIANVEEYQLKYGTYYLSEIAEFSNKKSQENGFEPCFIVDNEKGEVSLDWNKNGYRIPKASEWLTALGDIDALPKTEQEMNKIAWFKKNNNNVYHVTGQKNPTQNGLYDMLGNKRELCYDETNGILADIGGSINNSFNMDYLLTPQEIYYTEEGKMPVSMTIRFVRNFPTEIPNMFNEVDRLLSNEVIDSDIETAKNILNYCMDNDYTPAFTKYAKMLYEGQYYYKDEASAIDILKIVAPYDEDAKAFLEQIEPEIKE